MLRALLISCLLSTLITSCINEVNLPIRNEVPQLVVEGMITNEKPPYTVRLFTTGNFVSANYPPASLGVQGALVSISDDTGQSTILKTILEQPGAYQTIDTNFVGLVGRSYVLTVRMPDGKMYQSQPEQLLPMPRLEELKAEFVDVADRSKPSGYRILVDTQDPVESANYYR